MYQCDSCNKKPATVHMTEIKGGKKIEKHLCEQCAAQQEGLPVKPHTPINELLTNFVLAHSGVPKDVGAGCEQCGLTWAEFRQTGLLGCEHDYQVFEKDLTPLLAKAHEQATHHRGKVPARRAAVAGGAAAVPMRRSVDVNRLRKELQRAIEVEDYEKAAKLRDQIKQAEG